MNLFQNFTIKSRFNFINIAVIALILIVVLFFYLIFNRISDYNKYNENVDKLKIHYLNLRRYEQHFLLRYNEDPKFFISGENKYIDKLHNSSKEINQLTTTILEDKITERLHLTDIVYEIITVHSEYMQIFNELSEKIYKRGTLNSGIIGNLKSSADLTLESSNNYSKKTINEMIRATDNYLYTNNEEFYTEFLKKYERLLSVHTQNYSTIEDTTGMIEGQIIDYSSNKFLQLLNKFKNNFSSLVKTNNIIGKTYEEGLEGSLRNKIHEFDKPIEEMYSAVKISKEITENRAILHVIIFFSLLALFFYFFFLRFSRSIVGPLNKLRIHIKPLSLGILPDKEPEIRGKNEISYITNTVNNLVKGLKKTTSFANAIGERRYSTEYEPLSNNDSLGNALIEMRENLITAGAEEEKRKYEDEIRTWTNVGLTKFNDILRQSQGNIKEMSVAVISGLVKFINANQGGMFVFNDDDDDRYLELTAAYAYGKEKKKNKKIYPGEGMVGMVALEKETVYMTEIPETYITITSGLGDAVPKSLLIVPMIVEEEIIGVIELASFNELLNHEIDFVETLSENIASSLSITKINQRTAILLEQSQRQAELMKVQEEEMRQNFEELQQVQEDSSRRSAEMAGILAAIDTSSLVIEIDISGKIISVNRGLLEMLDVPESALTGINFKEFIQSVDNESYDAFWQQLMNGANIQRNEHIIIENKEFWFSVVYAPIIDDTGNILYILSISTDLSESKKLEFELKEQEKILRQNLEEINKARKEAERRQHILENTNEMLIANEKTLQSAVENAMKQRKEITKKAEEIAEEEALSSSRLEGINQTNITVEFDLEANIIAANKIFEDTFEYKPGELKSKKHSFILPKQYVESENYKTLWKDLLNGKHVNGNFNFTGKNNKKIFIQGTYTAIKDRRGKTSKVFLIGFDTTDLVIKTEELKARETELFFQIEDMQLLQDQSVKQQEELTVKAIEIAEKEAISESRFEGIKITNIVAEFDTKGIILFINDKFSDVFGYSKKEVNKKHHNMIISKEFASSKENKEAWDNLLKGEHISGDFPFLGKNKKKVFVQGSYIAIKDANGKTSKIVLMGFDTTDLVMKTEELKARETELFFQIEDMQLLQDQSVKQQEELTVKAIEIAEKEAISESRFEGIKITNIVAEFDTKGTILFVNDKFSDVFAYSKKEVTKKHHNMIITKEFASSKEYKEAWDNLLKGEHITGDFPFLGKNKKKVFVQGSYIAIKDANGKTSKIILMGFDTTELVMKTEELKARETELFFQIEDMKTLQDQSVKLQEELTVKAIEIAEKEAISESRFEGIKKTNLVAEFDKNGVILDVNGLFASTFGYDKNKLISKHLDIIISKEFALSEQYKSAWDQLLEGKHLTGEFPFIGKNNKKLFIQGTYTSIKDADSNTSKIILMGIDNTELIMRTEELRARETELEFQLEELKALQKKLKDK